MTARGITCAGFLNTGTGGSGWLSTCGAGLAEPAWPFFALHKPFAKWHPCQAPGVRKRENGPIFQRAQAKTRASQRRAASQSSTQRAQSRTILSLSRSLRPWRPFDRLRAGFCVRICARDVRVTRQWSKHPPFLHLRNSAEGLAPKCPLKNVRLESTMHRLKNPKRNARGDQVLGRGRPFAAIFALRHCSGP